MKMPPIIHYKDKWAIAEEYAHDALLESLNAEHALEIFEDMATPQDEDAEWDLAVLGKLKKAIKVALPTLYKITADLPEREE